MEQIQVDQQVLSPEDNTAGEYDINEQPEERKSSEEEQDTDTQQSSKKKV